MDFGKDLDDFVVIELYNLAHYLNNAYFYLTVYIFVIFDSFHNTTLFSTRILWFPR